MSKTDYRQYEIWHDESKKNGYHHGILLVPIDKRQQIINLLRKIREEYGYDDSDNIKFSRCLKKPKIGKFISNNLSLFSHIIKTKAQKKTKLFNRSGLDIRNKNFDHFLEITGYFGCRFGLLKIENLRQSLDYFENYRKKVETTFRFVVKGCCHCMFDKNNPVRLEKFYFDGEKQYKGRIDLKRLVKGEWRSYCDIKENMPIDARVMKQRKDETKLIMNLVDNVVGAWRALLNREKDPYDVLYPLKEIHKRLQEKKIFANKNSSWYKSISLSEFCIKNGNISFPDIFRNKNQLALFRS